MTQELLLYLYITATFFSLSISHYSYQLLLFLYLASVTMYALFRYLKIDRWISVIFALVFAYMPFISHRMQGHYTYVSHFLFPCFPLIHIFSAPQTNGKIFTSISIPLALAITIYSNFTTSS